MRSKVSQWSQLAIITFAFCLFACATYFWFPNVTPFEGTTSFHRLQARAFLNGELRLPIKPEPAILTAKDPFDRGLQKFWYWDAVFYKGTYYSYFGPFPAVLIAVGKLVGIWVKAPDMVLTLAFTCLRLFFGSAVLLTFWRHCRPDAPSWIFAIALISLAWCNPIPFILGRVASYEVSIVCAQALFLAGLLCDMRSALSTSHPHRWAFLSSIAYGACIASRASLLPAVLVMVLTSLLLKSVHSKSLRVKKLFALLLPLGAVGVSLGVLNYLRFGSPFESGQHYMFTVVMPSQIFQWQFVVPNIYTYFFRPLILTNHFPFVSAIQPKEWFLQLPTSVAYLEPVIGFFITTPLVLLSVFAIPVIKNAVKKVFASNRDDAERKNDAVFLTFIAGSVALAVGAFAPLLLYFAVTMRYFADCAVGFIFLSTLGLTYVVDRFGQTPIHHKLVASVAIVLTLYAIMAAVTVCALLPHH